MTRISIVIAAYNVVGCIERALRSALDQNCPDQEIVIVDDGSSDGTIALVENLMRQHDAIKLVRLARNSGPAAARNAGIAAATGDWVAILDADDAFLPGRLHHLLALAEREASDIVADNFYFYDLTDAAPETPALMLTPHAQSIDLKTFIAAARPYAAEADFGLLKPVFRRAFLAEHGLRYPEAIRHGEDFDLIVHCLLAGAHYTLSRSPYYLYTTRSSGFSRTKVDYSGQIARSRALSHAPQFKNLDGIPRLFEERCRALARLEFDRNYDRLRAEAGVTAPLWYALSRPRRWRYAAARWKHNIGRRLGR